MSLQFLMFAYIYYAENGYWEKKRRGQKSKPKAALDWGSRVANMDSERWKGGQTSKPSQITYQYWTEGIIVPDLFFILFVLGRKVDLWRGGG